MLFDKSRETLIAYPGARNGAHVAPEGVRVISENAFSRSSGLTSVTLPKSVKSIGSEAFFGSLAIRSVLFCRGRPTTGIWVFDGNAILSFFTFRAHQHGARHLLAIRAFCGIPPIYDSDRRGFTAL